MGQQPRACCAPATLQLPPAAHMPSMQAAARAGARRLPEAEGGTMAFSSDGGEQPQVMRVI
jgi:hypothetical protein